MGVVATEVVQAVGKELLDNVTKALALFISMTYAMGLIIVNSFMLTLGIRTSTLLSAEYISAGLPLALLFVVAALTAAFVTRAQQGLWAKILIPLLSLLLLGLILLYTTNLEDYPKTVRVVALIYGTLLVVFFVIMRDVYRRLIGNREKLIVWSALYGLILLAMVVAASTFYGRTVYNDILPTIGGGAGSTVSFVTDGENVEVLGQLVPMRNGLETEPVQLVRETADSFLVVLTDTTSVSLDKDLVKGVIHHRTRGWEIRPSWLD
ncbi:MAG: hypothetical protein IT328_23530 [Caldilineaceae bacterium]|nr:hypothetical protein [Caldilineaceae bacterium]